MAYGIKVSTRDDVFITHAKEGMHAFSAAGVSGRYLVDYIPLLKYVPVWFPGAKFRRDAERWRKSAMTMVQAPFAYTKEALVRFFTLLLLPVLSTVKADGSLELCAAAGLLDGISDEEQELTIRDVLAAVYAGEDLTSL